MTTEQYWQRLDTLAASKGTDRLLEAAELLRSNPSLPLLISCRRAHGRIQHLFTSFDDKAPDIVGNRYLICFTSEKQTKKAPVVPHAAEEHETGPDFSNLDERYGKRRKKGNNATWAVEAGETACLYRKGACLYEAQQSRRRPYLQPWRSEAQPRHSEVFVGMMRRMIG